MQKEEQTLCLEDHQVSIGRQVQKDRMSVRHTQCVTLLFELQVTIIMATTTL